VVLQIIRKVYEFNSQKWKHSNFFIFVCRVDIFADYFPELLVGKFHWGKVHQPFTHNNTNILSLEIAKCNINNSDVLIRHSIMVLNCPIQYASFHGKDDAILLSDSIHSKIFRIEHLTSFSCPVHYQVPLNNSHV
jgi:hypothetical protein